MNTVNWFGIFFICVGFAAIGLIALAPYVAKPRLPQPLHTRHHSPPVLRVVRSPRLYDWQRDWPELH